jgi:hypothetical protein
MTGSGLMREAEMRSILEEIARSSRNNAARIQANAFLVSAAVFFLLGWGWAGRASSSLPRLATTAA